MMQANLATNLPKNLWARVCKSGAMRQRRSPYCPCPRLCPKSAFPITLGCAYQRVKGCEINLANDEIAREEGFHHFGRVDFVTRSSFVTTATALLAITASSRKNPNSATLSGSEI